jgi:hypothetical protein
MLLVDIAIVDEMMVVVNVVLKEKNIFVIKTNRNTIHLRC